MSQFYLGLLVFLGGGIGSICRYFLGREISKHLSLSFPFSTLTINILGCLLIGVFSAFFCKQGLSEQWKLLFITGFCGGFTTFSTFSHENYNLLISGNQLGFLFYSSISLFVGLGAVVIGSWLGERI
jgi:fluoride exporter